MATAPEAEQPTPTRAARIVKAVKNEAQDRNARAVLLLAISAGVASLAPIPFGPLAAASLVVVAADRTRR